MEQIESLFRNVEDHKSALEEFEDIKKELKSTDEAIRRLESKKVEIQKKIESLKMDKSETGLHDLKSRIAMIDIQEAEINDVSMFRKVLSSGLCESAVLEKTLSFVNNYCIYFEEINVVSDQKKSRCSDASKLSFKHAFSGSSGIGIVTISSDLEAVIKLSGDSKFGCLIKIHITNRFGSIIENFSCRPMSVFIVENQHVIFCFSLEGKPRYFQGPAIDGCTEVSMDVIAERYPDVFKIIVVPLQEVLVSRVKKGYFEYKELSQLVGSFVNTSLYIKNLESWTLDLLVKEMMNISKHSQVKIVENPNKELVPRFSASSCRDIRRIFVKIHENKSERAKKAIKVSAKAIQKHFCRIVEGKDLRNALAAFSSIYIVEHNIDSPELQQTCASLKEGMFLKIIEDFSIKPGMYDSIERAKLDIKRASYEFLQEISIAMDEKKAHLFRTTFFEKSFGNFVQLVYGYKVVTKDEAKRLAEIGEYILSQCMLPPKELTNYYKVVCIKNLLLDISTKRRGLRECFTEEEISKLCEIIPWNKELEMI